MLCTNGFKKPIQENVFTVGNNSDELKPLGKKSSEKYQSFDAMTFCYMYMVPGVVLTFSTSCG